MTEPKRYSLLVLALVAGLSISACGGSSGSSNITPPPVPGDFALTVQTGSVSVTQGSASSPASVAVSSLNNFSDSVTIAISGLPSGVTTSPTLPFKVKAGFTQTVTFSAATSATLGPVNLSFTGTSGSLKHLASATMEVLAFQDFGLLIEPRQFFVTQGASSSSANVSITPLNSFGGKVTVDIKGLPAGIITSPALPFRLDAGTTQKLTFNAASSVAPGTLNVVFRGTSGSLAHSASADLQIRAASTPDFALSIDKKSLDLQQGTSQIATLSVAAFNHFGDDVAVNISGLPRGVTVKEGSSFVFHAGSSNPLTFVAAKNAAAGSAPATVTFAGVDGALSHLETAGVQVTAPTATVSVAYFDYAGIPIVMDSSIRIVNPGVLSTTSALGDLCANIYVFDAAQELSECCSCPVTANGFTRLSLFNNLVSNPNSPANFATPSGSVSVIPSTLSSSTVCDATSFTPVPNGLNVWGTRPAISVGKLVETLAPATPLSGDELTKLQTTCGFIVANDSGAGICRCSID
jgi:hypothetical protein